MYEAFNSLIDVLKENKVFHYIIVRKSEGEKSSITLLINVYLDFLSYIELKPDATFIMVKDGRVFINKNELPPEKEEKLNSILKEANIKVEPLEKR